MKFQFSLSVGALFLLATLTTGCGSTGGITIKSDAYTGALFNTQMSSVPGDLLMTALPTTFKFCVKKVKLESEDGTIQKDKDDSEDIEFSLGLIDVANGTAKDWGAAVNIPVGFKLKKIKIKVKKDETVCPTMSGKSLIYNDYSTSEDIEFRWKYATAIDLKDGAIINVKLDAVIAALTAAGGTLTNNIKKTIEDVEGDAHE